MIKEVKRMYIDLGIASNVKELIEMIEEYNIPGTATLTAAGGDCHMIVNTNEDAEISEIVFDEKDYSEEWNEEMEV
jgi:hypothetical protein